MQNFAPELVSSVFRYLDADQLFTCSLVCRQWSTIAKDALLWYNICRRVTQPQQVIAPPPTADNRSRLRNANSFTTAAQNDTELRQWFSQIDWRLEYRWRAMGKIPVRPVMHNTSRMTFSVHSVAYDEESELVVTVDDDGFLKYWRPNHDDDGQGSLGRGRYALSQRVFMDEEGVASISGWGATNGNRSTSFCNNLGMCIDTGAVYSSVGNWLQKRDLETGRVIAQFPVIPDAQSLNFVASILPWSPHSTNLVVTGSSKHLVDLWDFRVPTAPSRPIIRWHQESTVLCLEQSDASPMTLLCGGRFNSVNLYDLRHNRFQRAIYSGSHIFSLTNFNGGTIVAGGHAKGRGVVEVLDVRTESLVSRARGNHTAVVFGVSANRPRYSRLTTCSGDGTVLLWDETGRKSLRYLMESDKPVTGVRMGETRLAVAYVDGVCVLDLGVECGRWDELRQELEEDRDEVVDDDQGREMASVLRGFDMQREWSRVFGGFGIF
ncbi:WD40-repeat-containing domain protein [Jimgerdemannia flammicorona]|uniref:WD40-repeat-containing domain protein n=1 Tax=Jimgerdemannia flammicorona TaxID=994334 RepID=A0A433QNC5_9FUNG|nr:WD40-repeat-containing domain protein [Jimgerdemannia flammicorona]